MFFFIYTWGRCIFFSGANVLESSLKYLDLCGNLTLVVCPYLAIVVCGNVAMYTYPQFQCIFTTKSKKKKLKIHQWKSFCNPPVSLTCSGPLNRRSLSAARRTTSGKPKRRRRLQTSFTVALLLLL